MLKKAGLLPTLLTFLSLILAGCVSQQSEVATKFGYEKSLKVKAGPYDLHYGQSGTNELVLLNEGNWDMFSRVTGQGTDVYLDGNPFIHFDRSSDGSVTNLSVHFKNVDGQGGFTLYDRNAKGQWDMKIDDVSEKIYVWKDGHWIQH